MPWIPALLVAISTGIRGFFSTKQKTMESIDKAVEAGKEIATVDSQMASAAGEALKAEASSQYWLAALWRPALMVIFASIIISRWFGYTPAHITDEEIQRLYDLLELGIGGYIGGRTLEKIVTTVMRSKLFDRFISAIINRD